MVRLLLTAFEPFGGWPTNASALCLEQLLAVGPPAGLDVTARIYPVHFEQTRKVLLDDLAQRFDFTLHLGQAGGSHQLRLERTARNTGIDPHHPDPLILEPDGPHVVTSDLPLANWVELLIYEGHPATVSDDTGSYLCNATLYWCLRNAEKQGLPAHSLFVHLPLDDSQSTPSVAQPTYPAEQAAAAIRNILGEIVNFVSALQSNPK